MTILREVDISMWKVLLGECNIGIICGYDCSGQLKFAATSNITQNIGSPFNTIEEATKAIEDAWTNNP